jgi:hypothetical protein
MSVCRLSVKSHHRTDPRLSVTNNSTTHIHLLPHAFSSVPPTRQSAWDACDAYDTWLQSLGRYRRSCIGALRMHTTEPVGIIARRRSLVRTIEMKCLVTARRSEMHSCVERFRTRGAMRAYETSGFTDAEDVSTWQSIKPKITTRATALVPKTRTART